ncbi:hypothetical protein HAL1_11924 [Halomonas sp. HAL1]|nr:hypothetical protein HAL1_11924 [Halomonas sp. HAL1]
MPVSALGICAEADARVARGKAAAPGLAPAPLSHMAKQIDG